jgi:hypothetical protein
MTRQTFFTAAEEARKKRNYGNLIPNYLFLNSPYA